MIQTPRARQRTVGKTSLSLPALGFGAAPVGNLYRAVSDAEAGAALTAALASGMNYFDTAPHYGFGLSEQRLGQCLPAEVVVSSKVGRRLEPLDADQRHAGERDALRFGFADTPDLTPVFDYSYDGVMRSFDESLARLGRPIDVLYAHDLGPLTHGAADAARWREFCEGGYRALLELRASGAIKAFGLGVNEIAVCERALAELDIDLLLLAGRYTLLEQEAGHRLLPQCLEQKVAVVVGGPYNSGILATGVKGAGPFYYNYEPASADIVARVQQIETVCDRFGVPMNAAALQFPLAHPSVVSVIAGFSSEAQVVAAVAWMNLPIVDAFWDELKAQKLIATSAPTPAADARSLM